VVSEDCSPPLHWFQVPQPQPDRAAEAPGFWGPASPRVAVSPSAGPGKDVADPDSSSHLP